MQQQNGIPAAPLADCMARALEDYLAAAEAGTAPPRDEFLANYPELADDLDAFLAALRFIGRAAAAPRAVAGAVAEPPPEPVAGRLGDFRLLREVGRGGMGVVYEAEQMSLGRRVALKVLPFAATLDSRQLQRFHNEARAAAALDHPHIVHVHAVGCERAVHFYAMQFIEGQTLAALIADLRQPGGRPASYEEQPTTSQIGADPWPKSDTVPRAAAATERAPRDRAYFRRVAELGIQAAEALDHAHALGIVHRDVKPANLLVDGRGGLWVTDFGLAHIQSDARLTMTGDLVGTLRYMSPEQALVRRVVVDHRTDVYSLGATLYELLTLEPAFAGNDRQELLRQIAFEEPARPRRLNRGVPAELETIVLKALEKNPADRYATAKELADDLRRFLADEPIRARPAGLGRRLRKWGRRHPAWVAAAAAALTATVAVLSGGIGWVANDRATRAQRTADEVGAALKDSADWQQRRRVPEALAAARRAQAALTGGHGDAELGRRVEARVNDLDLLARLEEARLEGTAVKDGSFDDGDSADHRYGEILRKFNLDVEAGAAEKAGASVRASTVALELASFLDFWACLRRQLDPQHESRWKRLLDVARVADPDDWRFRLRRALAARDRDLLAKLASSDEVAHLPPWTLYTFARVLALEGAAEPAETILREAQWRHPDDFWINEHLGLLLRESSPPRSAEAVPFLTAAVALRPKSPGAYYNLGNALYDKGDMVGAIAAYRAATRLKNDYAEAHKNLGVAFGAKGDLGGAIAAHRQAIRLKPDYPEAHNNLGVALRAKGDVDGATAAFREAIRLKQDYAEAHNNLGAALGRNGEAGGAIAAFREAIRLKQDYAEAHYNLGTALAHEGRTDEAIAAFHAAIRLKPDHHSAHYNLGTILTGKGRTDEAIVEFRAAIRLKNNYPQAHCNLGRALRDKGQFAEALTHLRRGHEMGTKQPGWSYPSAEWVRQVRLLADLDRRAASILKGEAKANNPSELLQLARFCLAKKKHPAAATRLYTDAFDADPREADDQKARHRYNAACAAALAGCGLGNDDPPPDDTAKAELRRQALDWLRADLAAYAQLLAGTDPKAPALVRQRLQHWQQDADFRGVRGDDALVNLPEAERLAWRALWADVADSLGKARTTAGASEAEPSR
jgi:serine/threonine protein kinase/Flp pilus assembly protein TadD